MKHKNKIHITFLIFALSFLILAVFDVWPLLYSIGQDSRDLISAKNDIFTLNQQVKETDKFKKNYEDYKFNFAKIDQLFIDPSNPVDFIEFLENTASNFSVASQVSLQSSQKADQNFVIFQLSSNGKFSDILNLLSKIESGPYLVEVDNMNIKDIGSSAITKITNIKNISGYSPSGSMDAIFTIKAFTRQN